MTRNILALIWGIFVLPTGFFIALSESPRVGLIAFSSVGALASIAFGGYLIRKHQKKN
jgi:hypothetical protein